jgi:DNA polymerase delta subunit 2
MEEAPHVFFAGNQPEFATKVTTGADGQKVRLVCVPSFAASKTIVCVNVDTLECHPITFDVSTAAAAAAVPMDTSV